MGSIMQDGRAERRTESRITDVERYLYQGGGKHAIVGINLSEGELLLKIAEWTDLANVKTVAFHHFRILAMDVDNDNHEDFNLPWDIIAMDGVPATAGRFRFELHSASIMYRFESSWPCFVASAGLARGA